MSPYFSRKFAVIFSFGLIIVIFLPNIVCMPMSQSEADADTKSKFMHPKKRENKKKFSTEKWKFQMFMVN